MNNNTGFTLVELIVVLVILGILASVAVYTIIGYINLTRYNNNNQNAQSVYQAAESALTHMSEVGTLEDWALKIVGRDKDIDKKIEEVVGIGTPVRFDPDNCYPNSIDIVYNTNFFNAFPEGVGDIRSGESAHMRYSLTFDPTQDVANFDLDTTESDWIYRNDISQSEMLYTLLISDFKSTDILSGVITIEFDIEKSLDATKTLHYSAHVCSVFYDSRVASWNNNANSWTSAALNGSTSVPCRDEYYRQNNSLVGYYYANSGTTTVDSVYIPSDTEIKNTIFTLRNGETLDLTWSATADGHAITGTPAHIHYTFSLYDSDKTQPDEVKKICDLVVNENSILGGTPYSETLSTGFYNILKFEKEDFEEGRIEYKYYAEHNGGENYPVVYTSEVIRDSDRTKIIVYKASIKTFAQVYVHRVTTKSEEEFDYNTATDLNNGNKYYKFPITISYEIYTTEDGFALSERVSYTLSIDAMMSRNLIKIAETNANNLRSMNFSINRLFTGAKLTNEINPCNFYATMTIKADKGFEEEIPDSDLIFAERALDDPAYLLEDGTYCYDQLAVFNERNINYAIVNAYYGDLGNGSLGSHERATGGEAVITSFRHLYNARFMSKDNYVPINYSIQRDLNWYKINYDALENEASYSSDVIVFSQVIEDPTPDPVTNLLKVSIKGLSPVRLPVIRECTGYYDPDLMGKHYGDVLNVVSFPSIPVLGINQTLTASENTLLTDDKISSINNVQMRMASFYEGNRQNGAEGVSNEQPGYGLICVNKGNIYNIRSNGMTLVLINTLDGSPDDRETLKDAISSSIKIGYTVESSTGTTFKPTSPLGGLVGDNNGTIGSKTQADLENNTITFTNCIVSSMYSYDEDNKKISLYRVSACACVIGNNNTNVYGRIETKGQFISMGWIDVSAIIGYAQSDVDALLYVDNTKVGTPIINTPNISSLLLATADSVGGAIAYIKNNSHLCQDPSGLGNGTNMILASHDVNDDGTLTIIPNTTFYAVDVKLDENSYVLIRSNDEPKKDGNDYRPGGIGCAIGRITDYKGDTLSVRVDNKGTILSTEGNSFIDSKGNTISIERHLGGAIGILNGGSASNVYIEINNHANIGTFDRTSSTAQPSGYCRTTGGAVGRIRNFTSANGTFTINVINEKGIFGNSYQDIDYTGVGGAVGAITNKDDINIPRYTIKTVNHGPILSENRSPSDTTKPNTNNKIGTGGSIGCVQYLGRGSNLYCSMNAGASISTSGNNIGGVIGVQTNGMSSNNATALTIITVDLNGTSIKATGSNAGGSIGSAGKFDSYTKIWTRVNGSVSINALSNVGGLAGDMISGNTTSSSLVLTSTSSSSILTLNASTNSVYAEANENAGGLVGELTTSNAFKPTISMPTQNGADRLSFKIDSFDNAGGVFGKLTSVDHDILTNISLCFIPGSYIHARNNNAGGIIGLLEAKKNITSTITVTDEAALNNNFWINADNSNAGGIIGSSTEGMTLVSSHFTADYSCVDIGVQSEDILTNRKPSSSVGGCIGNISGSPKLNSDSDITLMGNIINVFGIDYVGGVVGFSDGFAIKGKVQVSHSVNDNNTDNVTRLTNLTINGNDYVGGVFGLLNGGSVGAYVNGVSTYAVISNYASVSKVSGHSYVGGCIGKGDNITDIYGSIFYMVDNSPIIGNGNYIGGVIGELKDSKLNALSSITFSGDKSNVMGTRYDGEESTSEDKTTGNNIGGLIGYLTGKSMNGTTTLTYNASNSSISGRNNVGGLIGYSSAGMSNENCIYDYKGTKCSVTGRDNVGGVLGCSDGYAHKAKITFSPVTSCTITGEDNVGGVCGLVNSRYNNNNTDGNLPKQPKVTLNKCILEINGIGYTGGIVGSAMNNPWYSGGSLILTENSELKITSNGSGEKSVSGGNIGYFSDGNLGNGTLFVVECSNSHIQVTANRAAGGIIGEHAYKEGKVSTPNITSFKLDADSTFNVTARGTDTDTYAGGIIGINGIDLTFRPKKGDDTNSVNISNSTRRIEVNAPNGYAGAVVGFNNGHGTLKGIYNIYANVNASLGYAGAVIGINDGSIKGTYTVNVTINDSRGDLIPPKPATPYAQNSDSYKQTKEWIIGKDNKNVTGYTYSINGSITYTAA